MLLPIDDILADPKFASVRELFQGLAADDLKYLEEEDIGADCEKEEIPLCFEAYDCLLHYVQKKKKQHAWRRLPHFHRRNTRR